MLAVKRAQLVLNHEWARRVDSASVVFQAMHPGWADTPGVRSSLPGFYRVMRPLLRSSGQGADTIVWLAAAPELTHTSGDFWLDRHRRWEHKVPWTRSRDAASDQARLWEWCVARTGSQGPQAWTPGAADNPPDEVRIALTRRLRSGCRQTGTRRTIAPGCPLKWSPWTGRTWGRMSIEPDRSIGLGTSSEQAQTMNLADTEHRLPSARPQGPGYRRDGVRRGAPCRPPCSPLVARSDAWPGRPPSSMTHPGATGSR